MMQPGWYPGPTIPNVIIYEAIILSLWYVEYNRSHRLGHPIRIIVSLFIYLFLVHLPVLWVAEIIWHQMTECLGNNEFEWCGRKQLWPNLEYPSICLKGLIISKMSSRIRSIFFNTRPPKYKAGVLSTPLQHSVNYNIDTLTKHIIIHSTQKVMEHDQFTYIEIFSLWK
jgi:hypothetical protein